jgi:putative ATP-binding cassette transporter
MKTTDSHTWSQFRAVALPFFRSEQRWRGIGLFVLLVVLLLGVSGLNVVNSYVGRDFMTAVARQDGPRVWHLALLYVGVFVASTVVAVYERFTEQHLGLRWRKWLTEHLTARYLSGRAYYRLTTRGDIDNPDQRLSQDVQTFTTTSLSFVLIILNSVITLCAFAGILWSITPWLFLTAVAYAAFGSLMTLLIGRRLVWLNFLQFKKEADLRYELIRVREYAGPIALQHAEPAQERRIDGAVGRVVDNMKEIIAVQRNLNFLKNGYNYMTQLIPLLIVAPLYISNHVPFGVVTQSAMAFSMVMGAFSVFVEQFQDLSSFAAVIRRVSSLQTAIEQSSDENQAASKVTPKESKPPENAVEVVEDGLRVTCEHLTLRTREGRVLVKDLNVEVPQGKRLLVQGPNAAGRTCLFRAIAGLALAGSGRIVRPLRKDVMFLPQHPYFVHGSLRDQFQSVLHGGSVDDERLRGVLREVQFEQVIERAGGLDAEEDWPKVLSPSEQQLLAFARLLLVRPAFAFLDDAAAVFEPARRHHLYGILVRTPITYFSAVSDPALVEYHDTLLELQANGAWRVSPLRHAASA